MCCLCSVREIAERGIEVEGTAACVVAVDVVDRSVEDVGGCHLDNLVVLACTMQRLGLENREWRHVMKPPSERESQSEIRERQDQGALCTRP